MEHLEELDTPAMNLKGLVLSEGWEVGERVARPPYATGGWFSQGYLVSSKDGKRGYLKVLDYTRAMMDPDPATVLNRMTQAFLFEREICQICVKRSMSKVVKAITSGTHTEGLPAGEVVQYLIFELADGDVRKHLSAVRAFDTAAALRALHHTCTGLLQLHGSGIAHQDLKPSNVLIFEQKIWKVADLGRACSRTVPAPHDGAACAGDLGYAPPEMLYPYIEDDWSRKRFGCDAYLLGSMVLFLFVGSGLTALMMDRLDPTHHWRNWKGSYSEILPYLRNAYSESLQSAEPSMPVQYREKLMEIVRELCDPDPKRRGHPALIGKSGNQYSMERYVSAFNLLAEKAEYELRKGP